GVAGRAGSAGQFGAASSVGDHRGRAFSAFPQHPYFRRARHSGFANARVAWPVYPCGKAPPGLVERILPIVHQVIADPDFVAALAAQGFEAKSSTPAELDAQARADIAMWGEIVKASGFKPT